MRGATVNSYLNCRKIQEKTENKKTLKNLKKPLAIPKNYAIISLVVTENVTQTTKDARLAQLVEHLTLNQGVQGSNP